MQEKKITLYLPRRDRVVIACAAFLFMTGQIVGALLNWFGYAWLWWLYMDRPKIFEGKALKQIFEAIERLNLQPRHTGTQSNEFGEDQWELYEWDHPELRSLQSCYDRRTTSHMFYSWAYPL
jgi:hypothetical protein